MKTAVAACLIATLSLAAAPACAQTYDFTITVPVNVSGLPDNVTDFVVTCWILPASSTVMYEPDVIGSVMKRTTIHGSFSGNVVLSFNANAGKDASLASKYKCQGYVAGTIRGIMGLAYFPSGPSSSPNFPLVAGAPFYMGSMTASDLTRIPGR